MNIPSVPHSTLTQSDGNVSNEWRVFFTQLVNQLQSNVSDEGFITPTQSSTDIGLLNTSQSIGGVIHDSDAKNLKGNTDGTYKILTTHERLTGADISAIPSGQRDGRWIVDTDTGDLKVGMNDTFMTVTVT
ncbi:MAG: hypothetical protein ACPG47_00140 [Leucothrix sp.]